jgi:hypothetical protein
LLRQNIKLSSPGGGFDAPWRLRIDAHKLATIIAIVPADHDASDKTRLRKATGCI